MQLRLGMFRQRQLALLKEGLTGSCFTADAG